MARRGKKSQPRTKKPVQFRLLDITKGLIVGNIVTQSLFRTNMYEFITGRIDGAFKPGGDGQAFITLPEIVGFASSPFGIGEKATNSVADVLRVNVMRPGVIPLMIGSLVLAGPVVKATKNILRPVTTPLNKSLRQFGVAV